MHLFCNALFLFHCLLGYSHLFERNVQIISTLQQGYQCFQFTQINGRIAQRIQFKFSSYRSMQHSSSAILHQLCFANCPPSAVLFPWPFVSLWRCLSRPSDLVSVLSSSPCSFFLCVCLQMKGLRIKWVLYTGSPARNLPPAGRGVNSQRPPSRCLCLMMTLTIPMRSTMSILCSAQNGLPLVRSPVSQRRVQRPTQTRRKVNQAWSAFAPPPLPAALTMHIMFSVSSCGGGRGRSLFFPYESEVPISIVSVQMPQNLHKISLILTLFELHVQVISTLQQGYHAFH